MYTMNMHHEVVRIYEVVIWANAVLVPESLMSFNALSPYSFSFYLDFFVGIPAQLSQHAA